MSSLVIAGDTSGSVTLQAPAVSGTTILTLPSTTGTVMAPTSNGTSGQVLTSSGSATPTWATPASPPASALTLLSTVTASNSATVDVETTFSSTYDNYLLVASGVTFSNAGTSVRCLMKIGGSYLVSGTYNYINTQINSDDSAGVFTSARATGGTSVALALPTSTDATASFNATIRISNPSSTALSKTADYNARMINNISLAVSVISGAFWFHSFSNV